MMMPTCPGRLRASTKSIFARREHGGRVPATSLPLRLGEDEHEAPVAGAKERRLAAETCPIVVLPPGERAPHVALPDEFGDDEIHGHEAAVRVSVEPRRVAVGRGQRGWREIVV